MERLDDGALARVTYLPGVKPVEVLPVEVLAVEASAREAPLPEPVSSSRSGSSGEPEAPPPGAARNVSISALARRGLSRRELERHLRDRDFTDDEIFDEVARLESDGYVDDIALAQNLVGTLQERKGLGRSAIAAELTRRLLAPAAIEYALDLVDTGDELSRAREIAVKRAGQLRHLDRDTAVRRLSAYLARRGYGGSTIRAAVDQALPSSLRRGVAFR
ncbi:regulatory protein RecX [Pseudolysinimonas sp.]|uniref:regulatory protein RecX n=1 Tax=Pseudolysinimonas sp. TaxID=2680009 RepID=UPI00286C1784|nr:regulatory protein RecX [Pseudolysinimonas sp.]